MKGQIRKPGEGFELTDEELLVAPARLLTPEQRKRRRQLRNNQAKQRTRAARRIRREENGAKVIFCQGYAKRTGEPCGSYAVTGAKHCANHLNEAEKARLGRKTPGEVRRENRLDPLNKRSGPQTARAVMEVAMEKLFTRYFAAIGLEFVGFDEDDNPIVYDKGAQYGICLHGESKEGYVHVSEHPDLAAQIQVIEKLMDRVYGKPRQTTVIEGGKQPLRVQPVRTVERAQAMAGLLARTGALGPHEGRSRPRPSEEPTGIPDQPNESGQVVPLRKPSASEAARKGTE